MSLLELFCRVDDFCMALTPGNVDDRKPVPRLVKRLFGKIFADNGYLSQALFQELLETFSLQLITNLKRLRREA